MITLPELPEFLPGFEPEVLLGDNLLSPEFNLSIDGLLPRPEENKERACPEMSETHRRAFLDQAETSTSIVIEDAETKVFDIRVAKEAIEYSKFVSEKAALVLTDPKTYRFSETPPQITLNQSPSCPFSVVIVVKFWKQVETKTANIPNYSIIKHQEPV